MGTFLFIVLFLGVAYFAPTIIAYSKNHSRKESIFLVNLLVGWTLIGWIYPLLIASGDPKK